jgi:hypothetical protein
MHRIGIEHPREIRVDGFPGLGRQRRPFNCPIVVDQLPLGIVPAVLLRAPQIKIIATLSPLLAAFRTEQGIDSIAKAETYPPWSPRFNVTHRIRQTGYMRETADMRESTTIPGPGFDRR